MERLLIKGTSKEDIQRIADLAQRLGLTVEYMPDEIAYTLNEPDTLQEWNTLTKAQQDGILAGLDEADRGETHAMEDVMKEFRKKYE